MKKFMFLTLAMILTLSAFGARQAQAAPPVPPGPQTRLLVALLSGPAIDGIVPSGKAEYGATQGETALEIRMSNLNLPDGARLKVTIGRTILNGVPVRAGSAFVSLSPSPEEVNPGEVVTISLESLEGGVIILGLAPTEGSIILSGTFQQASGSK